MRLQHTRQQHPLHCADKGVSLLIAIILLGSALLIVSSGALIIGLSRQEGEYAASRGGEARSLADGCMNEAFLRISRDASWGLSGAQPFTAPNGSCTIQVNDAGSGSRTIDALAQVAEYRSHIRATYSATTTPPSISAWEERND